MNANLRRNAKFALFGCKILYCRINNGLFLTQTCHCSNLFDNYSKLLNTSKSEAPQQQNLNQIQIDEDNSVPHEFSQKILSLREQVSRVFSKEHERVSRKSQWFAMQISGVAPTQIILSKSRLSVHDREAVNKGVKSRGIIFGYTINRNAIPNAHPTSLDHYLIEKHNPDNIYLKWMSKNPRSGCHPGQLLKFRNASYLESQLRCFSSLFEKPFHWWKTEPGYEALLHSMKIKPFVQQRKTDAVENTSYMGMAFGCLSKVDGKSFNLEQSRAIYAAIDPNHPIVGIHGPPGSGKYRTAVEIAAKLAAEGKRGLFVVTSNDSYQKLLKDLELCGVAKSQILLVTCTNQARDYSVLQKCHPKWTQLDDLYQRLKVQEDLEKYKSEMSKPKHNTSFDLRQIEAIQKEISALHNSINFDLFRHINIFVRSIDRQGLVEHFFNEIYKLDFQIVLNGKFAVFEYEYVSLLRQARRTIIIEDIMQKSSSVRMSLLEHHIKSPGFSEADGSFHRFGTQYQSNAAFFEWPNRVLYQGQRVESHPSVANLRLTDLLKTPVNSSSQLSKLFENPLVFIDVDLAKRCSEHFCIKNYMVEGRALSDVNLGQVAVMCEYAKALFASGLRPAQIGFCLHGANNRIALRQLLEPVVLEELGGNPPSDSDHPAIGSYATFRAHNFSREVILMSNLHLTQPTSTPRRVIVEQLAVTMTLATRHFVLIGRRHFYDWLKSPEIDELIVHFREKGAIVPPETLFLPSGRMEPSVVCS